MRALIARPGTPVPQLVEVADPTPGPGEVAIRTTAATVNPVDVNVASGAARELFGLVGDVGLGWDFSGTVVAVGADVATVRTGQRVAAVTTDLNQLTRAHAEVVVVPAPSVAAVPDGLDDAAAATVSLNALTAAQIVDLLGASDGRTLLVTGAAGAVGGYVLVLAADAGWQVTGLARETDRDFVTGTGARLVTELPERAYDAVADAGALQQDGIGAVVDSGVFVGVLPPLPVPSERGIEVKAVFVQPDGARLAGLLERSVTGELGVRVAQTVPFEDYQEAYDAVAVPHGRRGRVVLTF